MPLTTTQENDFNQEFNDALTAVSTSNWSQAELHFDKAYQLLNVNCPEIPMEGNSLKHILFLFKCISQFKNGKQAAAVDEYFKKTGLLYSKKYNSVPPYFYYLYLTQLLRTHPWVQLKFTPKNLEAIFAKSFRFAGVDFAKDLWSKIKSLHDEDKSYYKSHLTHDKLNLPAYLDFILAANDAYARGNTTADSSLPGCPHAASADGTASLKSLGWELIDTATTIPSYKPDEYFGKVYIDKKRKTVLIAHKGTNFSCMNDLEQDHQVFRRQIPEKYLKSANELLDKAKTYLTTQGLNDYRIFTTGHSLGGALAELIACQHMIPTVTFDSPGIEQIIENHADRFKVTDPKHAPVTGVLSLNNIINTCNGHVGRTLHIGKTRKSSYALPIPNVTIFSILKELLKEGTRTTLRYGTFFVFMSESNFNNLSKAVVNAVDGYFYTTETHTLDLFVRYFTQDYPYFLPDGLATVLVWPNGIQDGTTEPKVISHRERIIPLSFLPPKMQIILQNADKVIADPNFPLGYDTLKEMLEAVSLTDENGGEIHNKDHIMLKGQLTIDEFRLYLWDYFDDPRHKILQTFFDACISKYKSLKALTVVPTSALLRWLNPVVGYGVPLVGVGLVTKAIVDDLSQKSRCTLV